jgi:AcrR family transcriptional regulator
MAAKRSRVQRRSPKQARSRATWDAIVEAASQILERGGPDALNTNDVAARAGVSIGTLYQYFPDKQAILLAAARRELGGEAAPLLARQKVLIQALIAMLESIGRLGAGTGARTAKARVSDPAPVAAPRLRGEPGWERRCVDLARRMLLDLARPVPATLLPISSWPPA